MSSTALSSTAGHRLGRSVTIDQAAVLIGVSRRTVYYRIRQGRLQTIRTMGGSQRVLLESLQQDSYAPRYAQATHYSTGNVVSRTTQRTL